MLFYKDMYVCICMCVCVCVCERVYQEQRHVFHFYLCICLVFHSYLDGLVSSSDKSDEEREHHVNEQRDERVEVNLQGNRVRLLHWILYAPVWGRDGETHLTEDPDEHAALLHATEGHKHVISIDQREKTLRYQRERAELRKRNKHDPYIMREKTHVHVYLYTNTQ